MAKSIQTEVNLEMAADEAIHVIRDFFKSGDSSPQSIGRARVAGSVISSWTRHKQTESARDATNLMMARELAADRDELKRYIEISMPGHPLTRALPGNS